MSKELEAFKKIAIGTIVDTKRISIDEMDNCLKIVENGLKRLAKYEAPPRLRYSVHYEYRVYVGTGKEWVNKKNTAVESLNSYRLKEYFHTYTDRTGCIECLIVIIKDKWNKNKLIYEGNDYEEFKRKCLK